MGLRSASDLRCQEEAGRKERRVPRAFSECNSHPDTPLVQPWPSGSGGSAGPGLVWILPLPRLQRARRDSGWGRGLAAPPPGRLKAGPEAGCPRLRIGCPAGPRAGLRAGPRSAARRRPGGGAGGSPAANGRAAPSSYKGPERGRRRGGGGGARRGLQRRGGGRAGPGHRRGRRDHGGGGRCFAPPALPPRASGGDAGPGGDG